MFSYQFGIVTRMKGLVAMNKILKSIIIASTFMSVSANELVDKIEKFKWENIDVTYIQDDKFPTYNVTIFFADGAIKDGRTKGVTKMMFDLLESGTNRFSLNEIADNLEFYGVSTSSNVTHEFSSYSYNGLAKDIIPTTKKICHIFRDAVYPAQELSKAKKSLTAQRQNLVSDHGELASTAFRTISLKGTPYVSDVRGRLADIKRIKRSYLQSRLKYFRDDVKKKVYITGPRSILKIKNIVTNECGFDSKASFVRNLDTEVKEIKKFNPEKPLIHFVEVPKANQAQVRAGIYMAKKEDPGFENLEFMSQYLGGGFTSILVKELRTKRGLTYSAWATAGMQKDYGRSILSTFTKEETVNQMVQEVIKILKDNSQAENISMEEIEKVRKAVKGGFAFQFQKPSSFMRQLVSLDNSQVDIKRFLEYTNSVDKITQEDVAKTIYSAFPYDKVQIVVLGDKKMMNALKKIAKIKVYSYKNFL